MQIHRSVDGFAREDSGVCTEVDWMEVEASDILADQVIDFLKVSEGFHEAHLSAESPQASEDARF